MLFTDDTIVFAEASIGNVQNVLIIIELFCQCSRQRINVPKSCVVILKGTQRGVKDILFRTNCFQQAGWDFSYPIGIFGNQEKG